MATRNLTRSIASCFGVALGAFLGGCRTAPSPTAPSIHAAACIQHVVLVRLLDESKTPELAADSAASLPSIPGVSTYSQGHHVDIGRSSVDGSYSLGLIVGFDSEADYRAYLIHPAHTAFVDRWLPAIEWIKIYDIGATTP